MKFYKLQLTFLEVGEYACKRLSLCALYPQFRAERELLEGQIKAFDLRPHEIQMLRDFVLQKGPEETRDMICRHYLSDDLYPLGAIEIGLIHDYLHGKLSPEDNILFEKTYSDYLSTEEIRELEKNGIIDAKTTYALLIDPEFYPSIQRLEESRFLWNRPHVPRNSGPH